MDCNDALAQGRTIQQSHEARQGILGLRTTFMQQPYSRTSSPSSHAFAVWNITVGGTCQCTLSLRTLSMAQKHL